MERTEPRNHHSHAAHKGNMRQVLQSVFLGELELKGR